MTLRGTGFPVDGPRLPEVRVGPLEARVVRASPTALGVVVPEGIDGGTTAVRLADLPGETAFLEVGRPVATEIHQVDSPAFDRDGRLYVTISGRRGQSVPEPLFRVLPDGERQALAVAVANPTSLAFDSEGRLHVSSRFEGTVFRLVSDERAEPFATDLGTPCGLAFGPDGALYVGDRAGSILRVTPSREVSVFASLPQSVAAYHLAFGPDDCLYVSAPTLCSRDAVYRVGPDGGVGEVFSRFGRPQGLAFDREGFLYVVEALAGASGLYRLRVDRPDPEPECVLAGDGLVGVAVDPRGGLVVASNTTAYRLEVPLRPAGV